MNKVLYNTKYLQLKQADTPNGHLWCYAHRPNATNVVVVLPISNDEILFLIEERPPLQSENKGKYCIGLPAGLVGDERINETTAQAIEAELLEEAGLKADKIKIKANKVAGSSGCISETCTIAIAYIKDKTVIQEPVNDGGIISDRIWIKKSEVLNWLNKKDKEGYVISAHTLGALFYLFAEDKL